MHIVKILQQHPHRVNCVLSTCRQSLFCLEHQPAPFHLSDRKFQVRALKSYNTFAVVVTKVGISHSKPLREGRVANTAYTISKGPVSQPPVSYDLKFCGLIKVDRIKRVSRRATVNKECTYQQATSRRDQNATRCRAK